MYVLQILTVCSVLLFASIIMAYFSIIQSHERGLIFKRSQIFTQGVLAGLLTAFGILYGLDYINLLRLSTLNLYIAILFCGGLCGVFSWLWVYIYCRIHYYDFY